MTAPTWQNLRAALYTRLDGQIAHPVYSPKAPQDADGESIGPFPYVVIVQATESPFNTDGTIGSNFVVQIDGFARGSATVSVENSIAALHSATRTAIERYPLTVTGAVWIDTVFEDMSLAWSDVGTTRRFISQYRITLDASA
jgi:hypothetical protein